MTKIIFSIILTITALTALSQEKQESLKIEWPEQYHWKVMSDRSDGPLHVINIIPGNEEAGKWSIQATMKRIEGEKFVPMEIAMNNTFNQLRQTSPKATVMLVERDKDEKNHWIIFKVESASSGHEKGLESKLFYIIQGESSLFYTCVTIKEKALEDDFTAKWAAIFKKSQLEYNADLTLPGFRIGMLNH